MDSSGHQLKVASLAKALGLDPARLSKSMYTKLSIQIRTKKEVLTDGAKALGSIIKTELARVRVPDDVAAANAAVCRSNKCGAFIQLDKHKRVKEGGRISLKVVGQEPACDVCNCSSRGLESKWANPSQKCPKDLWDNTKL